MDQYEITALHARNILNSHAEFTTEFVLDFGHGTRGIGASVQNDHGVLVFSDGPYGDSITFYKRSTKSNQLAGPS